MKPMSQEQIEEKKDYFRKQIACPTGNYTDFVIRTYYYILQCCRKDGRGWCYGREASDRKIAVFSYQNAYNGRVDHMGGDVIDRIKQVLQGMGYISFKKDNEEWKIYIQKDLDFLPCPIDEYIARKTENKQQEKADKANEIFEYLVRDGIKVFRYDRACWSCGKRTPIFSYYLDVQIKNELPSRCLLKDRALNTVQNRRFDNVLDAWTQSQSFSEIGIGVLEKIDSRLAAKINTVEKKYSGTMQKSYFMNICENCGAKQGMNFTVYHPQEIEYSSYDELKKYCVFKIFPNECGLTKEDILAFIC